MDGPEHSEVKHWYRPLNVFQNFIWRKAPKFKIFFKALLNCFGPTFQGRHSLSSIGHRIYNVFHKTYIEYISFGNSMYIR